MFGYQLKSLREAAGIRQIELAEELGVHPNTVWRWEKKNDSDIPVTVDALVRM